MSRLQPHDEFRSLGAIRRNAEGAEVAWTPGSADSPQRIDPSAALRAVQKQHKMDRRGYAAFSFLRAISLQ